MVWSAAAAGTFGYDFLAYHAAATRVIHGEPLYDVSIGAMGGFGLFFYPPPFVVAMLPFAFVPGPTAAWIWLALSVAMLVAGIAMLPVRPTVRWATLLLAGTSWPVVYALKLGQVGPLLLLLFAAGWRWADRPARLGVAGALGALVKVQPGIVLAWALLTRRWAAVAIGVAILVAAAAIATLVLGGVTIWPDYLTLLRNVSDPITTPHNFTPGAVAFQMGASTAVAAAIQLASSAAVVIAVVLAAFRLRPDASFMVAVIASQLLSPVLWDHYAMLLLIPVAWLLDRRQWWAVIVPLATSVIVLPLGLPPVVQPVMFWVTLIGVLAVGWLERTGPTGGPAAAGAPSTRDVAMTPQ